jgi:hypothetical protein
MNECIVLRIFRTTILFVGLIENAFQYRAITIAFRFETRVTEGKCGEGNINQDASEIRVACLKCTLAFAMYIIIIRSNYIFEEKEMFFQQADS